jgi:hypothetical protein
MYYGDNLNGLLSIKILIAKTTLCKSTIPLLFNGQAQLVMQNNFPFQVSSLQAILRLDNCCRNVVKDLISLNICWIPLNISIDVTLT